MKPEFTSRRGPRLGAGSYRGGLYPNLEELAGLTSHMANSNAVVFAFVKKALYLQVNVARQAQ